MGFNSGFKGLICRELFRAKKKVLKCRNHRRFEGMYYRSQNHINPQKRRFFFSHSNTVRVPQDCSTGYTQKNGAILKVNKKFISHLTRAQRTPSAAATVQVSHELPTVRFSCLLRGSGSSFKDGVAAGKGFLCAPF